MLVSQSQGLIVISHDATARKIKACGITISPVAPCEVIIYWGDDKTVVDGIYGCLPDGSKVVGADIPDDVDELDIRVILDPYHLGSEPEVIDATVEAWDGCCPLCNSEGSDDEDEPFTLPDEIRFTLPE